MSELIIKGRTVILGKEVPVIYGGFGDDQKTILAKTAAELHNQLIGNVNRLINDHISDGYFEEGIDIIDLKNDEDFAMLLKHNGIMTQNAINASDNIYLLSQQGYSLLLKLMDTELAVCISTAVSLCRSHEVDISDIIEKFSKSA